VRDAGAAVAGIRAGVSGEQRSQNHTQKHLFCGVAGARAGAEAEVGAEAGVGAEAEVVGAGAEVVGAGAEVSECHASRVSRHRSCLSQTDGTYQSK